MSFKPAQGHLLQVHISSLMFYGEMTKLFQLPKYAPLSNRLGGNRKRSEQSMNSDHNMKETVFSIVICRQSGDNGNKKNLFLTILDLRSSIILTFSIAVYLVCLWNYYTEYVHVAKSFRYKGY